jgi:hypothetical protein
MKQLNKAVVYTLIAILLGTVTMIAPIALLGPDLEKNIWVIPSANESGSQTLDATRENNSYNLPDANQSQTDMPKFNVGTGESPSNPSQIGSLLIPSFLVALGAFLLFKKRNK